MTKQISLGPLMLDIAGVELSSEDKELLLHPSVGGVILFTRNYESIESLEQLISSIHNLRSPHLLVAVDHEGGRVQRFRENFTSLPSAGRIGKLYEHDDSLAKRLAELAGWLMATELRTVDIDFSFAPVLDLDYGVSQVIGDRAFHRQPSIVTDLAYFYMKGMHEAGMAAVGKHFPGHGAIEADSHIVVPVDERHYEEILEQDIVPFRRLIASGLAAVMPAHVIYREVDTLPAGFSRKWIKEVLRDSLQSQGVVFSDDLDMKGASAVAESYADRTDMAIDAGCDMVLVCNNRDGAVEVAEKLEGYVEPVSHMRLVRMHGRHRKDRLDLHKSGEWNEAVSFVRRYQEDMTLELDLQ